MLYVNRFFVHKQEILTIVMKVMGAAVQFRIPNTADQAQIQLFSSAYLSILQVQPLVRVVK